MWKELNFSNVVNFGIERQRWKFFWKLAVLSDEYLKNHSEKYRAFT